SFFFFQAEDGIRDFHVTGVQTCALPIYHGRRRTLPGRRGSTHRRGRRPGVRRRRQQRPLHRPRRGHRTAGAPAGRPPPRPGLRPPPRRRLRLPPPPGGTPAPGPPAGTRRRPHLTHPRHLVLHRQI